MPEKAVFKENNINNFRIYKYRQAYPNAVHDEEIGTNFSK